MRRIVAAAIAIAASSCLAQAQAPILPRAKGEVQPAAKADDDRDKFFKGYLIISKVAANLQFRMILSPDGKMTRRRMGSGDPWEEGTWAVSGEEICTTLAGAKHDCFVLQKKEENEWSVIRGSTEVAVWSFDRTPSASTAELLALRARLMSLWKPPGRVRNLDEAVVPIRILLNPDATLAAPPKVLKSGSSSAFIAARDSAVRAYSAVSHSRC